MGACASCKILSTIYLSHVGGFLQFYSYMLNILNSGSKKAWPHKRATVSGVADFAL